MRDKYSIAQRNRVVEENLCCIDTVLRRNRRWVRHIRLEYDDLYQNLALCLILSVEEYDSSFGPLRPYLYRQLQEELRKNQEESRAEQEEYRDSEGVGIHRESPYEDWLEYRKAGIGGSDAAVVCGISRYKSPVELWMEKTGQLPAQETGEAAYWGNLLESLVREEFTKRTGISVTKPSALYQSEEHPFMLANVDGLCEDPAHGPCIFEAKTASAYKAGEWEDSIPDEYMIQIQHYMAVTGCQGCLHRCAHRRQYFPLAVCGAGRGTDRHACLPGSRLLGARPKGHTPGPGWFRRLRQVPCRTVPQQRSPV